MVKTTLWSHLFGETEREVFKSVPDGLLPAIAGSPQALYSRESLAHPSECKLVEATVMLQSNTFSGPRSFVLRQHFCSVFAVLQFLLLGPSAGSAGAQDRSLDNLRNLNQSVDALIKKVSPSV